MTYSAGYQQQESLVVDTPRRTIHALHAETCGSVILVHGNLDVQLSKCGRPRTYRVGAVGTFGNRTVGVAVSVSQAFPHTTSLRRYKQVRQRTVFGIVHRPFVNHKLRHAHSRHHSRPPPGNGSPSVIVQVVVLVSITGQQQGSLVDSKRPEKFFDIQLK